MFEVGWTEMLVIAVVMIVIVGPKDLPNMLRTFGRTVAKLRAMAGDFQKQFNDALKEAELDDVKKSVDALRGLNPASEIKKQLNPFEKAAADVRSGLDGVMKPKPAVDPSTPAVADAPKADETKAVASDAAAATPAKADSPVAAASAETPATRKAAKPAAAKSGKLAATKTASAKASSVKATPAKTASAKSAVAKAASAKPAPIKTAPAKTAAKPAPAPTKKPATAGKKTAGAAK